MRRFWSTCALPRGARVPKNTQLAWIHTLSARLLDNRQPPPCKRLAAQLFQGDQSLRKVLARSLAAGGICTVRTYTGHGLGKRTRSM